MIDFNSYPINGAGEILASEYTSEEEARDCGNGREKDRRLLAHISDYIAKAKEYEHAHKVAREKDAEMFRQLVEEFNKNEGRHL